MDYDKLIEQAKKDATGSHPVVPSWAAIVDKKQLKEYAIAIKTLRAENEKLRAELADLRAQWDMYGGDDGITAIYAELERVKAERAAAAEELENYMVQDVVEGNAPCEICAKASFAPCEGCDPKWRGIKKEG